MAFHGQNPVVEAASYASFSFFNLRKPPETGAGFVIPIISWWNLGKKQQKMEP